MSKKVIVILPYTTGMSFQLIHVIGGLLYAELTNRIPIVIWNKRCIYYDSEDSGENTSTYNLFEHYFQPVSDLSVEEIVSMDASYFPSKWGNSSLLNDSDFTIRQTEDSTLFPFKDREFDDFDILVFDQPCNIKRDLMPHISQEIHLSRLEEYEILYYFYNKYIKLSKHLEEKVNSFYQAQMQGRNILGVHIRKTDKSTTRRSTGQIIPSEKRYIKLINSYLGNSSPATKVFLASDSTKIISKFTEIYGDKIIFTDSIRSSNQLPVHLAPNNNKLKGEEILIDMYLLSKCNYFIGTPSSGVSKVVNFMLNNRPLYSQTSTLPKPGLEEKFVRQLNKISESTGLSKLINKI